MKRMIICAIFVLFLFHVNDVIAQTIAQLSPERSESKTPANPFIGKWQGEWIVLRTTNTFVSDRGPKTELVVKEDGMLQYQYDTTTERREYSYLINGDVLYFTTHLGKILEFKLVEEGKLKGVYKDHNWYCVLDRVP